MSTFFSEKLVLPSLVASDMVPANLTDWAADLHGSRYSPPTNPMEEASGFQWVTRRDVVATRYGVGLHHRGGSKHLP